MTDVAVLRILGSLIFIIALLLTLGWLVRRQNWIVRRQVPLVRIVGSQRLGPRATITVVEVEEARLVLGVSASSITLLHTLPPKNHLTEDDAGNDVIASEDSSEQNVFQRLLTRRLPKQAGHTLVLLAVGTTLFLGLPQAAWAQETMLPALTSVLNTDGSQTWSLSVQTLVLLTALSFLPAILLTMTGFTRIIIVLGLLRNALGTGASPPNSVLIGLALFLTFFAMAPVFDDIKEQAWQPLSAGDIVFEEALQQARIPLERFMLAQTRETDLTLFSDMAQLPELQSPDELPLRVLLPAFVTSELKTAFQIGFTIFIPFLIIDLVVASILMSLGMMMVPPVTISLPFKLMLFVLADGWHLLLGSLARSFYI